MEQQIVWSPGVTLVEVEKQVILKAFRFFRGNKTATSNALGISIRTLDARLEEYEKLGKEQEISDERNKRDREQFLARQRGNPTVNDLGVSVLTAWSNAASSSFAPAIANAKTAETSDGSMGTSPGVRVEPVIETKPQQAMSMPERKEVQSVSPRHTPTSNPKKSR